jgi:putative flavoprotein involved in K+ transport
VAGYLRGYARTFEIPVHTGTRVTGLRAAPDGPFQLTTTAGHVQAETVVIATGPFQHPAIPAFAKNLSSAVTQLHSSGYRRPSRLPDGPVLVVGAGNSGLQIAAELSATRPVTVAAGTRCPALPQRIAGRHLFWWLERLGIMDIPRSSPPGRLLSRREPVIGTSLRRLRRNGVTFTGRLAGASNGTPVTTDGRHLDPRTVIWATGYRQDYTWLPPEVLAPDGRLIHDRGITPLPGLAVIGQPWQHSRGSALLGWVRRDAQRLARQLQTWRRTG